jgi:hypothetical protein
MFCYLSINLPGPSSAHDEEKLGRLEIERRYTQKHTLHFDDYETSLPLPYRIAICLINTSSQIAVLHPRKNNSFLKQKCAVVDSKKKKKN